MPVLVRQHLNFYFDLKFNMIKLPVIFLILEVGDFESLLVLLA